MLARHRSFWALMALALSFYALFVFRNVFWVGERWYGTLFDDAMISMRFAQNLAAGHGLVWNPGEAPIEGYTNFLWTLWLALLHGVPVAEGHRAVLVAASSAAMLVANAWIVRRITERLAPEATVAPLVAAGLVAFSYPLVFWSLRGMEVGALTLLVDAGVLLALAFRDRPAWATLSGLMAVMAAAALVRTDAIIPVGLLALFAVLVAPGAMRLRAAMALGAACVLPLAAHTTFRLAYYHDPLPNTYYLKVTGVPLLTRLQRGLSVLVQPLMRDCFALLPPAAWLLTRRPRHPGVWLLVGLIGGQFGYSVFVGGDAWEWFNFANRYCTVALPALAVLAALGLEGLMRRGAARFPWFAAAVPVALMAYAELKPPGLPAVSSPLASLVVGGVALGAAWLAQSAIVRWLAPRPLRLAPLLAGLLLLVASNAYAYELWVRGGAFHAADDARMTRLGLFLRERLAPEATIAVVWAGALPYYAERFAIDELGKSDAFLAKGPPATEGFWPGHTKWNYSYSLGALKPDVIAQLWQPAPTLERDLAIWGYDKLSNGLYIRRGSPRVDRTKLDVTLGF